MAFSSSRSLFISIATILNSSGDLDGCEDNDENPKQLSNHDPDDDKEEERVNDSSVK